MVARIDTISGRRKLTARTEPYWYKLSMGKHIGYRKLADGSGRWITRKIENREKTYAALNCDEHTTFTDAQKMAHQFFDNTNGIISVRYTVQDAIDDYIEHLTIENSVRSARECRQRLTKHTSTSLSKIILANLTSAQVKFFRDKMVKKFDDYHEGDDFETEEIIRKSKDSANRVMNMFKAAMNLAYRNDYVNSDAAWKKVPSFRGVGRSRKVFFTDEQVTSLLMVTDGQFQNLLQIAVNTGARYGEVRSLKVSDLDVKQKTLYLARGKTGERVVFLSEQTMTLLNRLTKLRHPTAFLLVKDDGEQWGEKDHYRRFKQASEESSLPDKSVFYCLRHYYISKALLARVSPQVIAENCGTSVKMIEKHYGKFMNEDRLMMLNQVTIANIITN